MTLQINQHLVVTKAEALTLLNAIDVLEVVLYGNEHFKTVDDFPPEIIENLKYSFPQGLLEDTREKVLPITPSYMR